jgi:hypothetical protein
MNTPHSLYRRRNSFARRCRVEALERRTLLAGNIFLMPDDVIAPPSLVSFNDNENVSLSVEFSSEYTPSELSASWSLYGDGGDLGTVDRDFMDGSILEEFIASLASYSSTDSNLVEVDLDPETPGIEYQYYEYTVTLNVPAATLVSLYDANSVEPFEQFANLVFRVEEVGESTTNFEEFDVTAEINTTEVELDATINGVSGPLVVGSPLSVDGVITPPVGDTSWVVYFDANNDANFEPSEVVASVPGEYALGEFGPELLPLEYTPATTGNYRFELSAAALAFIASDSLDVSITSSAVVGGVLYAGANSGGSAIIITPGEGGTQVNIDGNTVTYGDSLTQIIVTGSSGNDVVVVGNVDTPAIVFGEDGNDVISGGSGNDVLSGGDGNDVILGGAGRNLLIGGTGSDVLIGGSSDDILIAGYTLVDNDAAALVAIMNIWTNNSLSFAARTDALRAGHLMNEANVFDDDAFDLLAGTGGLDWYFANLVRDNEPLGNRDLVAGMTAQERAQYEELVNEFLS